eukprot:414541-Rhodomonas_salina.3
MHIRVATTNCSQLVCWDDGGRNKAGRGRKEEVEKEADESQKKKKIRGKQTHGQLEGVRPS